MATEKDPAVDALIDGVAQAMTGAPPSPALRAEVMRRISVPAAPVGMPRAWAAAAALAVVAVAIGGAIAWRNHGRGPAPRPDMSARASRDAGGAAPASAVDRDGAVAAIPIAAPPPRTPRLRGPARQTDTTPGVASTVTVPLLAIAPLRTAGEVVDGVPPPAAIDIDPLALRPLALAELSGDQVE